MTINFNNIKFVKSFIKKPGDDFNLPQVVFVGKSNVGKSSLINNLTGFKNLAYTSSKPGHTKLLNFFEVDNMFYLVDAPGYGYSASNKFSFIEYSKIMDDYLNDNKYLRFAVILIDGRREFSENDLDMIEFFNYHKIKFVIIFTKIDKLNQKEKHQIKVRLDSLKNKLENVSIFYSNFKLKNNLSDFKEFLTNNI